MGVASEASTPHMEGDQAHLGLFRLIWTHLDLDSFELVWAHLGSFELI